jgi:hypothetical protein
MGEANGLHQHLRVAGILALIAAQDRQRLPVAALGLEQPQQTLHGIAVPVVVADRLTVLLHGPVVVPELLRRRPGQPARHAVVGPQAHPLLERLEGLGRLPALQEQAAAQQVPHDRGFEARHEGLRLVVVAGADQQIDVGSHQRGRRLAHQPESLGHGVPGSRNVVPGLVVTRQGQPPLDPILLGLRGGPEQILGLVGLADCAQAAGQSLYEAQTSGIRLVGAPQDFDADVLPRSIGEELDRAEHHELLARRRLQALVPERLGCGRISLLLRERGRGSAEPRLPAGVSR